MLDILAIGDAIVDKIIHFDETDEVMQTILPVKGRFFVATKEEHSYLRDKEAIAYYAGGSAANTVRNMAFLGVKAGFIGKTGLDEEGVFFQESLTKYGVQSFLYQTDEDKTGCSVVMVHADKDRTQCAHACAANLLQIDEVKEDWLKNTKSILLEGYMLNRRPELVEALICKAFDLGVEVYFTLSDEHCVIAKKELILKLLPKIKVLFGNEYEFDALAVDPKNLKGTICVRTCGGHGVEIICQNAKKFFKTNPLVRIVNTNGAGDAFASGFLMKYQQNETLKKCVEFGHKIAKKVLKTNLSYLPENLK